ncbi:bifunctional diguanylate cyclase/phosphodiesterase [Marinomonas pollencensis]|uniref:PAS domain S-box-containing protein/diguanylate cyclase (GGDEF)-like protein n=1 Tax=Marinomonas pollencensis TaxID=491954 RepID=A0A3E0DIX3_9GAMM|nr:EAL domain-containing protein [Marinomonas pollencensis]REG82627.1 PAS domain S-box-containing protein/diguanylate cyclase (GGDEF)-like protein [Marinomonas pollencensis]
MHRLFQNMMARPKHASIFAFLLVLFMFSLATTKIIHQQHETKKTLALSLAQSNALLLKTALDKNLSANYTLAAAAGRDHVHENWFPAFAARLKKEYPDVSAFALSPDGVVRQVFPYKSNEAAIGFDQLADLAQGSETLKAKEDGRLTLAGPMELVQGGQGVIGRLPVYLPRYDGREAAFWGFTNVVIHVDTLLHYVNFADLNKSGFDYQLVKVSQEKDQPATVISTSSERISKQQVAVSISVPNGEWQLILSPQGFWLSPWIILGDALIVLLISFLIGRLVFMALTLRAGKADLERQVERRTEQLSNSNRRMKAVLSALPDSFYEADDNGVVTSYHSPRMDEWLQAKNWPLGKHFSELLGPETVAIFERVMAEAKIKGFSNGHEYYYDFGEHRRWFEMSMTYTYGSEEQNGFYILLSREITERKAVESELRIAATAFQTQDGILISDAENKIIRVNSAFESITGYQEAEVLGESPSVISSGRHPKAFYREMFQRIQEYGSWEGEVWNRRKNGEIFPEWLSISVVKDDEGKLTHYVATFKDISESKANERRINQLNYYDSLTRLPNRRMLCEEIDYLLTHIDLKCRRSAVLFIDLDHFKDVNDLKGHHLGDILLQQVASRLMDATRSGDSVARFSGDEFVVVLEDVDISENSDRIAYRAKHVANKVMAALRQAFELNEQPYALTASIGIAIFGQDAIGSDEIIKQAEMAMYEAKGHGRNHVCFYAPQMHEKILERVTLDTSFRLALQREEFVLYYQPQWDGERNMVGVEALVRWIHPTKGMISPGVFIPFAEESKLILPLGRWVMKNAMVQLAKWQENPSLSHLVMSINVSVLQFTTVDFVSEVEEALRQTGVNPAQVQLELTESMLVRDQLDIIQKMQALKTLGVLISLDDFGTGYSSLSYLQQLPIDQLKIDQSFTRAIEESDKQASLAASIIGLGQNLGMEVIAEGVETQAQFEWLKNHGCNLYQGFLLGRPQPSNEFVRTEEID